MKKVGAEFRLTVNMGNQNSFRVGSWAEDEYNETVETFDQAYDRVFVALKTKVIQKASEVRKQWNGNGG